MAGDWKPRAKFTDPTRLSRKVFDKHVDQVEIKRKRDRDDHRADMKALICRIVNLEDQLTHLTEHVQQHCERISVEDEHQTDTRDS